MKKSTILIISSLVLLFIPMFISQYVTLGAILFLLLLAPGLIMLGKGLRMRNILNGPNSNSELNSNVDETKK